MSGRHLAKAAILLLCCQVGLAVQGEVFNYYMASQYIDLDGNIALGKPASQSSVDHGGVPERGNDGLVGQTWSDGTCIHTRSSSNGEWWTVDLGVNDTAVKVVKLFNRLDSRKAKDLDNVEIRVGNEPVSGAGAQNPLCTYESNYTFVYEYPNELPYYPTLFRCDDSAGRYVTVRIATGKALQICEAMVFSEEKEDQWIMKPKLVENETSGEEECPPPLLETCLKHEAEGLSKADSAVKAFMEGPVDCGGKGFFCRVKQDYAGKGGGMTGGPLDDFVGNENFGYCVDRAVDRQIDWNNLGRQPNNNDGHCHGSEFDDVYIGVLHDHYYRPYRGTLECCCGLEQRDEDGDWAPAKEYISRCDYRGRNGNDGNENFERGCGYDMLDFIQPDEFPDKENVCWEMENFGRPYEYLYGKVAPYAQPQLEIPYCQGGEDSDWTGCLIRVDSQAFRNSIVMVSPGKVEPRMIDDIDQCDDILDVEVSEVGLKLFKFSDLDAHGHETDFVRLDIPAGESVHVQVIDTYSCAVSDLVSVDVPTDDGLAGKKKLRKMLK